jgi:hypothetical protein
MSNPAVGAVYEAIIEDVIKKSKEDFEESGVEDGVLEALREVSYTNPHLSLSVRSCRSMVVLPSHFRKRGKLASATWQVSIISSLFSFVFR